MRVEGVQADKRSRKFLARCAAAVVMMVAPALAGAASPPPVTEVNDQFFDWFVNTTPSYLPSPFLTDANAGSVNAFLKTLPANVPHAVKVEVPISNATANLIFNNPSYHISYVLGDIEQTNAEQKVKTLAEQVRFVNGQNNGTKTQSFNAFIGNFGFQKLGNDITTPSNYSSKKGTHSFAGYAIGGYQSAKLNLSMPELYPGSASFRNPAAGNSTAPNIRSALFTLPILRVSQVEVNTDANERNIPWVARFNNFGNPALDTDRNGSNGYLFVPGQAIPAGAGFPAVSAAKTANQMLSRRDFAALTAHYRMRGADSYVLFEPGVIGYGQEDKRRDAKAGWTESHIDAVFNANDYKLVLGADTDYKNGKNKKDINSVLFVDGKEKTSESTGSIFSGVYSLSLKTMDILLSNMDEVDHTLTLPNSIGGFALKTKSFEVDSGQHLLIEYKLTTSGVNKGWSVALTHVPFQAINNSRNGFGIPEPTTISLAAVTGFMLVGPRRRRARNA
jgi:hypothetical protein